MNSCIHHVYIIHKKICLHSTKQKCPVKLRSRQKLYTSKMYFSNLQSLVQAFDDGDSYQHVPFGILSLENEDVALQPLSIHLHPSSVGIILEGNVGQFRQHTPGHVSSFWFNLCTAPRLPKVHGQHLSFHSASFFLGLGKKELKGKILAVTNQCTM